MVIMTEIDNEEAIAFLQKRLAKAGVEKALEEAGARDGDEITIAGVTFEFAGVLPSEPEGEAFRTVAEEEPFETFDKAKARESREDE
jgi:Obg family GTPase CgtA-like protein